MDPEEEIIGQLGLMLTQLRFARRALEDIERSTARYGGFDFSRAFAAGTRFGEPPLLAGALKVHVVNINDLAPGTGLGGFLEGLLGGVGRFFGGLVGGLVGGTIGGVTLPLLFTQAARIADRIDRILDRFGIRATEAESRRRESGAAAGNVEAASTGAANTLTATLNSLRETVDALAGLFRAAASGPEAAAATSQFPLTTRGQRWMAMLQTVRGLLDGIARVIDGLILLVPILIGSLAMLIARLDSIKLAVLGLLEFLLRNVFILRGAVLATVYDTISAVARLAARVLAILSGAVTRILTRAFNIIGQLLRAAVEVIRFVTSGLQRTIDALLRWLLDALGAALTTLGNTRVFRVIVHVIQQLPDVLPPLFELIRETPLGDTEREALQRASRRAEEFSRSIAASTGAGPPSRGIPAFPGVASLLPPPSAFIDLAQVTADASRRITREVEGIFNTAGGTMRSLGERLNQEAQRAEDQFHGRLQRRLREIREQSRPLAAELTRPREPSAPEGRRPTGFEAIAQAYEQWLSRGGLNVILRNITRHFQAEPTTESARGIPGRVVAAAPLGERPRATIEIRDVLIELEPPPASAPSAEPAAEPEPEACREQFMDQFSLAMFESSRRGRRDGPWPLLAWD